MAVLFKLALMAALLMPGMAPGADVPVLIQPGEAVVMAPDNGGMAVSARGGAAMTPLEMRAASQMAQQPIPDAPVPLGTPLTLPGVTADAIAPGKIVAKLYTLPNGATMLVIENGLSVPVRYHASFRTDGQNKPTDVCPVPAGRRSFEYWPHGMDEIALEGFATATSDACE